MRVPSGVPLIAATRGPLVESVHAVAACALDARGGVRLSLGDVAGPVYLRSAWKPFIAAAVVASGAAARFGFEARELAVMAASHSGEAFHLEAVRAMLGKTGLGEAALQCGGSPAVANNCSGKHAGILALCMHAGYDPATYLEEAHPAQRFIRAFCARLTGDDPDALPAGVDGCGIPVYATSLRRGALAFARFATLEGVAREDAAALASVRTAMAALPAYVGGTGRFDSALIEATGGAILGKVGAEGVHGDALLREGLGLMLKVVDGERRAVAPATLALLRELDALEASERAALAGFASVKILNLAGRSVGRIEPLALELTPSRPITRPNGI
jgi:L-asparaginase II